MENDAANQNQPTEKKSGFMAFLIKRVIIALVLIAIVMWALAVGVDYMEKPAPWKDRWVKGEPPVQTGQTASEEQQSPSHSVSGTVAMSGEHDAIEPHQKSANAKTSAGLKAAAPVSGESLDQHALKDEAAQIAERHEASLQKTTENAGHAAKAKPSEKKEEPPSQAAKSSDHEAEPAHPAETEPHAAEPLPTGVTFVNAIIYPIEHELTERFWGWRPNDIINVTDNVNNFQLGVLEVTRRAVVQLAERISRTGSTDSFNRNLENSMNWLMVKADRYWFPSPEAKYKESLDELKLYRDELMLGDASFHTRADNLIPLLSAFEDLLGSSDENLVKTEEADGTEIGFLKADNYFYYAKGVATAMASILEAIHHDFEKTLINRHGEELLHHAIVSCRTAASLDPWVVTNGALDGILANHRAHMAAPISHARFYIGQLIKTLST